MTIRLYTEEEAENAPGTPTEEEAAAMWRSVYADGEETNTDGGNE